ncbi:MAG TPA: hypothetical protein VMP68_28145 [Candidatus Eisenbacteria bacterium]|nr:hypothetical protein [Candidatus Eisenbacteria bacterium]
MYGYPDRCQHIKVNGTQCGSPALRRNRFCFFHKRFQDERIHLSADRRRRGVATFILPVLEDANSIQMAIMQIMRLILTGQIEHKTASLLLYALQTASTNLRSTKFEPRMHQVILNPRDARDIPLDCNAWDDEDFEEEDDEEELDEVEAHVQEAMHHAGVMARIEAEQRIKAREQAQQREHDHAALRKWSDEHPDQDEPYINEDGRIAHRPRKPPVSTSLQQARADVAEVIHQNLPAIAKTVLDAARTKS